MRHDKVQSACLITGPGQSRKTADLRSATEIGKVDTRFTLIRHGGRAEDWVGSKKTSDLRVTGNRSEPQMH